MIHIERRAVSFISRDPVHLGSSSEETAVVVHRQIKVINSNCLPSLRFSALTGHQLCSPGCAGPRSPAWRARTASQAPKLLGLTFLSASDFRYMGTPHSHQLTLCYSGAYI